MKTEITRRWSIGESLTQIANALGITRGAVSGHISRMRQHGVDISRRPSWISEPKQQTQKLTRIIPRRHAAPEGAVTIIELQPWHCRAIMDGRKNNLPTYCGNQRMEDSSYCSEHMEKYIGGRLR